MKFEMFDVVNYENWGDLVKKWAREPSTRPANMAEFVDQLDKARVEATFPHEYTDLSFIEASSTSKTLIIKLPPPDLITNAETAVKSGGYQLPDFYGDDMENSALRPTTDKLVFHSKRVGEYTIKFCG